MKYDGHAMRGALQIDLDGVALGDRSLDRRSAVLDDAIGLIVQSAMGDRPFQPVERITGHGLWPPPRYSTAKMASISTGAPSGRLAQPTAMRVWRPFCPSTFTISSEAPLITLG